MAIKLSDLVQVPTKDALVTTSLASLSADGFPVTSWESGDVGRTLVQADVEVQMSLWDYVAASVRNRFISIADAVWAKAHAEDYYQETPIPEVATQGLVVLTDAASTGPHSIPANDLWLVVGASGLRFNNTTAVTVPLGGTVLAPVQAEQAGANYNVSNGTITVVGTSGYAGLTVANPAATNPANVIASGLAAATHPVLIEIRAGGAVSGGAVTYAVSTNFGSSFAPVAVMPSSGIVVISGVTLTFSGVPSTGDSVSATFTTGSLSSAPVYLSSLTSSNTWITQAGRNEESAAALAKRSINKWGTLAKGSPIDAYLYWAKMASDQVTKVTGKESVPATGIVTVTLAGPTGSVSSSVVARVKSYIDSRRPAASFVVVRSATSIVVNVTGTATARAADLSVAQSDVAENFALLADELDMGATIYWSEIVQRVMDARGVIKYDIPVLSRVDTALAVDAVVSFDLSGLVWAVQ